MKEIRYPRCDSEFEIQAELFYALQRAGVRVCGEVISSVEEFGRKHTVRLDLVIFNRLNQAIAIIECKNVKEHNGATAPVMFQSNKRQGRRYRLFEIPVFQCVSKAHIPTVIEAVLGYIDKQLAA